VIQGTEDDVGANPGRKSRAEIMESVDGPADGPIDEIVLTLEGVDVGEEHSNEERSRSKPRAIAFGDIRAESGRSAGRRNFEGNGKKEWVGHSKYFELT